MRAAVAKISKKFEKELNQAVNSLIENVIIRGHHPEDVVVAMVKSGELKTNLLPYVVYSYNNGRVVDILKNSKTAHEKCAEFPIIRLDKVLKKLGMDFFIINKNKNHNNYQSMPLALSQTSQRLGDRVDTIYLKIKYDH